MTTHEQTPTGPAPAYDAEATGLRQPSRPPLLLALGGGLLLIVSAFLEGAESPDEGSTTEQVRKHLEDNMDTLSLQVFGESLSVLGIMLLVVGLLAMARAHRGTSTLRDLTMVAGGLTAVWMMMVAAIDAVPLVAADGGGKLGHYPGDTLQALDFVNRIGEALGDVAAGPRGLFVLAVSLLVLRTRMLPRWVGWLGLFVAVASLLAVLTTAWPVAPLVVAWFVSLFGFFLWILVVAITAGIRALRADPA